MPRDRAPDPPTLTALDAALELPPFFSGYDAARLKTFLPSLALRDYEEGELIVKEGEVAKELHILLQGAAAVVKDRSGTPNEVARLAPGDSFGELAALAGTRRSASVLASEPSIVASMAPADLEKIFERHPELAQRLEGQARQRVSELRKR